SLGFLKYYIKKNKNLSPVCHSQISFKKPVHYGEKATVETWIDQYDGLRTVYAYQNTKENGEIAVSGTTKHVIVHKESFRPLSLRKAFPEWHRIYLKQVNGES